jgi:hypothetical protein
MHDLQIYNEQGKKKKNTIQPHKMHFDSKIKKNKEKSK